MDDANLGHRDNTIQSVSRSLATLDGLNANNGSSPLQLARLLGLPRATVYRILDTLAIAGYVRKDPHTGGYWLEEKVLRLGSGYRRQSWILDDAELIINEIYNEFHWCVMLCAPEGHDLRIRVATLKRNLQGGQRSIAGRSLAMSSGPGLTFMSFCDEDEREDLLDHISSECDFSFSHSEDVFHGRDQLISRMKRIREHGYYFHIKLNRAWSLSVPVLNDEKAIGVLNMSFFAPNAPHEQLVGRYLPVLQIAAGKLGRSASRADN